MSAPPDEPAGAEGAQPDKPLPTVYAFVGLGLSAAGAVAVGVVLGVLLDKQLGTAPLFLLLGLVLGVAAAVGSVIGQIRRYL
jgi:F0F1-type ATP synthase assembly protein I